MKTLLKLMYKMQKKFKLLEVIKLITYKDKYNQTIPTYY